MMKPHTYEEIKQLIPEDCFYGQNFAPDEQSYFFVVEGDWHLDTPLNLDFEDLDSQYDEHPNAIIVKGNMNIKNLYNGETDGSVGLIVLGNLTAENIVVGGQQIYVAGDLNVSDLYWGDYNHDDLLVKGEVNIRVFLESDYGYDYQRFRENNAVNIQFALYDDDECEEAFVLKSIFKPEFIYSDEEAGEI